MSAVCKGFECTTCSCSLPLPPPTHAHTHPSRTADHHRDTSCAVIDPLPLVLWYQRFGVIFEFASPRTPSANVTVSLPSPTWEHVPDAYGRTNRWTWNQDIELICKVDPAAQPNPLEPELTADATWDTFLTPAANHNTARLQAFTEGFATPEEVSAAGSDTRANYASVFPPGAAIDPTITGGWVPHNLGDVRAPDFESLTPAPTSEEYYWPPRPMLKVAFMPRSQCRVEEDVVVGYSCSTQEGVEAIRTSAQASGWLVNRGELYGAQADGSSHGWRCEPVMSWFGHGASQAAGFSMSAFAFGNVRNVGNHYDSEVRNTYTACPDGEPNTYEVAVDNGVYTVTVGHDNSMAQPAFMGCTFENVRTMSKAGPFPRRLNQDQGSVVQGTQVFTVEVLDGRFTLSNVAGGSCSNVNWIKLDRLTPRPLPKPWLPAPTHEWWQMRLEQADAAVGLVEIILPYTTGSTFASFPGAAEPHHPDCRTWWIWGPAKCYRHRMLGMKRGTHPELAQYPDFPGYTRAFLENFFDEHDANADGNLTLAEYKARSAQNPYAWSFYRSGWYLDAASLIFQRLDYDLKNEDSVVATGYRDGIITRDHFLHGELSKPRSTWCEPFEEWTGYARTQRCGKWSGINLIPQELGAFPDDGQHGVVVAVSNEPCTDDAGCDTAKETVCMFVRAPTPLKYSPFLVQNGPVRVDCSGARGEYVRIRLPGQGERLFAAASVHVHRAASPLVPREAPFAAAKTRPPMACYGVQLRPPPAANDPNVLIEAKKHAMQLVVDNPEDPIFYSTCFVRALIKSWLPLERNADATAREAVSTEGLWRFANGQYCLACDSYKANHLAVYNLSVMRTPHWALSTPGVPCLPCAGTRADIAPPVADNVERVYAFRLALSTSLGTSAKAAFTDAVQQLAARYAAQQGVLSVQVTPDAPGDGLGGGFTLRITDAGPNRAELGAAMAVTHLEASLVFLIADEGVREEVALSVSASLSEAAVAPAATTTAAPGAGGGGASTGIYIGVGVAAAVALVVLVAVAVVVHKRRPRRVLAEGMASTSGHSSSAF